jgi:hypothetical protein
MPLPKMEKDTLPADMTVEKLVELRRAFLRARIGENFRELKRFSPINLPSTQNVIPSLSELHILMGEVKMDSALKSAITEWASHRQSAPLFQNLFYPQKLECVRQIILILSLHHWIRNLTFMVRFQNSPEENLGTLTSECYLLGLQALLSGSLPDFKHAMVELDFETESARARVSHYRGPRFTPQPDLRGGVAREKSRAEVHLLPPVRPIALPTWKEEITAHPQLVDAVAEFAIAAVADLANPTVGFRTTLGRLANVVEFGTLIVDIFVHVALNHVQDHLNLASLTATSKTLKSACISY